MNIRTSSKQSKRAFKKFVLDKIPNNLHVKWKHFSDYYKSKYFGSVYSGEKFIFYIEEYPLLICQMNWYPYKFEHLNRKTQHYIFANWRGCIDKWKYTTSPFIFYNGDFLLDTFRQYQENLPLCIKQHNDWMFSKGDSNYKIYEQMLSTLQQGFWRNLNPTGSMLADFKKKYVDEKDRAYSE